MPAIRRKAGSVVKQAPVKQEDYDTAILHIKTTLRITPKTAKHLCTSYQLLV